MRFALDYMRPYLMQERDEQNPHNNWVQEKKSVVIFLHVKLVAACLNSRTGFTHVGWLYCILHSESTAP